MLKRILNFILFLGCCFVLNACHLGGSGDSGSTGDSSSSNGSALTGQSLEKDAALGIYAIDEDVLDSDPTYGFVCVSKIAAQASAGQNKAEFREYCLNSNREWVAKQDPLDQILNDRGEWVTRFTDRFVATSVSSTAITFAEAGTASFQLVSSASDVSGKPFSGASGSYPTNSLKYSLKFNFLNDDYSMKGRPPATSAAVYGLQTLEQVLDKVAFTGIDPVVGVMGDTPLLVSFRRGDDPNDLLAKTTVGVLLGGVDKNNLSAVTSGDAFAFHETSAPTSNATFPYLGKGSWEIKQIFGKRLLVINFPYDIANNFTSCPQGRIIYAENTDLNNGQAIITRGELSGAGCVIAPSYFSFFNKTAADALVVRYGLPALP